MNGATNVMQRAGTEQSTTPVAGNDHQEGNEMRYMVTFRTKSRRPGPSNPDETVQELPPLAATFVKGMTAKDTFEDEWYG